MSAMEEYVSQTKAREKLMFVVAEIVARSGRDADASGHQVVVDPDLMRLLADTIDAAYPGLVDHYRVRLSEPADNTERTAGADGPPPCAPHSTELRTT